MMGVPKEKEIEQWRNRGGRGGQLSLGAAGKGAQNSLAKNIL